MKKLPLAIACATLLAAPLTAFAAGSSYVTGNVQFHSTEMHGSSATSTLEAGHTFSTGTTILTEFDGIQVGDLKTDANAPTYITLGLEQSYSVNDNLWVAAGYHHLIANGENVQYRPLVKIGYNFDNGLSISNRTRWHLDATDAVGASDDTRMDNAIAYAFSDSPVTVKYNNVYMLDAESMDHEFRATWTRSGVQPYIEYRSQGNNVDNQDANNALVLGASYGF
ncbi:oligogalacturonate-specific porin KdgM family protein [Psychromonas ossibalaenae]|uniref:oligogalacturonate-specific porin KdgM family protein n=1 Tax=Psychromonas ossibalaenae TaxID=444922 RepID=UPI00037E9DE0|nr:oligogalacturonate-specific porin KdgM family protein [Psychromonas ossibalaenae]